MLTYVLLTAVPCPLQIIEHYGAEAQASSGGRRISAAREMLFATSISHPNVVSSSWQPSLAGCALLICSVM